MHILCHVKVYANFLIVLQLHDNKWISSLTLSQRRIQPHCDKSMSFVVFGKDEEFLDGLVLDFIVVCFAS
jgi:hypothetical protein